MDLSIVIPCYNEEENINPLYKEIKKVLEKLDKTYEIIFVDDGSKDNSLKKIQKIKKINKNIKIIQFRRNFGKSSALDAAFQKVEGDTVITMDCDLQDDPKEIPRFLDKLKQGYDLVSGWKYKRKDPLRKRFFSKIFNKLTTCLSGLNIHDFNCGFKAYRKEVIKEINLYGDMYRYIPALAYWKGFNVGEIKVEHKKRKFGKSKYGLKRVISGFLDLLTVKFLTTYGRKPAHFFGTIGTLSFLTGGVISVYLLYLKFLGQSIGDRPLLVLAVLLLILGIQFISLGLLGEMSASTRKKEYSIKEVFE